MKAIISARHFKTQDYYGMLQELCPELRDSTPGNLRSSRYGESIQITHYVKQQTIGYSKNIKVKCSLDNFE